ncbi:MAG TPA: hypothetical protein VK960_02730 [Acidimicrobiia bacterium]|nr:hypothetical protein [Acidimicrobiia bacterium]
MTQPRRPSPRPRPSGGSARQQVLARRRIALIGLIVAVALTLAIALFTGSVLMLIINLVIDVVLAGYIAMLLQIKQGKGTPQRRPVRRGADDEEEVRVVPR